MLKDIPVRTKQPKTARKSTVAVSNQTSYTSSTMNVISKSASNKNFTRAQDVKIPEIYSRRFKTGKEDLDNIFGGNGFLPGFTFTLAAAPGTGKTSMLLQILELLEKQGKKTAYISGEENVEQLAFTSKRLNVNRVPLANITDIDELCKAVVEHKCDFVVIDSLPAITSKKKMNKKQLEEYITTKIIQTAKENEIVIGTILHFTKTGTYKGSTLLPHSVDCNVIMNRNKEDHNLRDIDVTKNRFGSAGQALFEMTPRGFTFDAIESQSQENAKGKKGSKRDAVLSTLESAKTVADIASESGVSGSYLATLLRELTNEGLVTKTGKGASATFQKK
jgi:predicted ATP-dependent serine protease